MFLAWLALPAGLKWLDIGCGTGALTSAILSNCSPAEVIGLDLSGTYVAHAQRTYRKPEIRFVVGDATKLFFHSVAFDASVSGLVLNFVDFDRVLAEQHRVVRPGGTIAAYVWDYAGEYEIARRFWDAAKRVDSRANDYDPGRKASICREERLREAMIAAGCAEVATCVLDGSIEFDSVEAYWSIFDGRQGSTFDYLALLTEEQRIELRDVVLSTVEPHEPINLKIRALAVKALRN